MSRVTTQRTAQDVLERIAPYLVGVDDIIIGTICANLMAGIIARRAGGNQGKATRLANGFASDLQDIARNRVGVQKIASDILDRARHTALPAPPEKDAPDASDTP